MLDDGDQTGDPRSGAGEIGAYTCGVEEQRARFRARAAMKRAETDKKNAASRRAALERATAAEVDARRLHDTPAGARWQARLMTRRGVRQAVEHVAREHGITATGGGLSAGGPAAHR